MRAKQIRRTILLYQTILQNAGIKAEDYPLECAVGPDWSVVTLQHVAGMLPKMLNFTRRNQMSKAQLCLGFVQAILWANGLLSLKELDAHNYQE